MFHWSESRIYVQPVVRSFISPTYLAYYPLWLRVPAFLPQNTRESGGCPDRASRTKSGHNNTWFSPLQQEKIEQPVIMEMSPAIFQNQELFQDNSDHEQVDKSCEMVSILNSS